jgi:hypothetical protein
MSIGQFVRTLTIASAALLAIAPSMSRAVDEPADPLAPLAWTVGGKWVGEVKASDGTPLVAEATFDWTGHHKALKFAVVFKANGKATPQYEGAYFWHPGKKKIVMIQTDHQGNLTESELVVDGKAFKQANQVFAIDGTTRQQRAEWVREGDDAFAFKATVPKDGEWVQVVAFTYKRVR